MLTNSYFGNFYFVFRIYGTNLLKIATIWLGRTNIINIESAAFFDFLEQKHEICQECHNNETDMYFGDGILRSTSDAFRMK